MPNSTDQHIHALSEQGYTIVRGAIDPDHRSEALTQINIALQSKKTDLTGPQRELNLGDDLFLWNMQARDFIFLKIILANPAILEIIRHFLNDPWYSEIPQSEPNYILHSFIARSSGQETLRMHVDSLMVFPGPNTNAISTLFCLEDATVETGATQLVPRSHLAGRFAKPEDRADAIPVEAAPAM